MVNFIEKRQKWKFMLLFWMWKYFIFITIKPLNQNTKADQFRRQYFKIYFLNVHYSHILLFAVIEFCFSFPFDKPN